MKRALITGAAGFVGRHFDRRLVADGWSVARLDIAWPVYNSLSQDCRRLFDTDQGGFDLVIHCAAIVGGIAHIQSQPMAVADDLSIDAAMWQWALRTRPGRVVFFSSSYAYPERTQTGDPRFRQVEDFVDFDDLRQPDSIYGWVKLMGEVQARLVRAEGVPVTVVRPFSGYGSDQDPAYPFRAFIDRAMRREDPFTIWGDGQQVRDWIHVDDIVGLVMACVEDGIDGPINACTGRPTSFDDLAAIVCAEAGYSPELRHVTDAPSGVRYRVGDPTLMCSVFEPRVSLEEGVARALAERKAAA